MGTVKERPRLGLALGGGVARGWAHIGVLRAFRAAGIEPDIVCGTSIGAVVGACMLSGRLDQLEVWALSLNRIRMLAHMDFKVRQPGLIGGERLAKALYEQLGRRTIEQLDRPFAVVCTDLVTGHEVWLREGSLVEAVRASYSMPGIFPPMPLRGQWLVDGALVNPVPVSCCRALGARLVVAINLNADPLARARTRGRPFTSSFDLDLMEAVRQSEAREGGWGLNLNALVRRVFRRERGTPSLFNVMIASLGVVLDRISRSRLAGDPPDLQIAPKIGHIGFAEFDRAAELIELGRQAAEAAIPDLKMALAAATEPTEAQAPEPQPEETEERKRKRPRRRKEKGEATRSDAA